MDFKELEGLTPQAVLEMYDQMSTEEKDMIDRLIVEDIEAVPWRPMINKKNPLDPTPQQQAFDSLADILLYGGAAGGGKSSLIAGLAMTAHKRSVIYRREKTDLSALIDEVLSIHGSDKGYNSQKNILKLPGNRSVSFEGMQHEKDKKVAQGKAKDLICYDEVTQFLETQVRYSMTWNRPTKDHIGQRCRVVMASNPPDSSEGDWIISFFAPWLDAEHANPAMPGELRYFISNANGEDVEVEDASPVKVDGELMTPRSRTFIPSSVDDNVYLEGSGYKAGLQALPEPLRSQMLRGDFLAGREDDPWQLIPTAWIEAAQERWTERRPSHLKMSSIGFDPTRGGKDKSVLAPRYGWWFAPLIVQDGSETPDGPASAAFVSQHVRDGASIEIDIIGGAGASTFDHLRSNGMNVEAVDGRMESHEHDAATGRLGFFNKRSEIWWRMREALDPETGMDLALPPSRTLKADLCAPRWQMTPRGIQVEGKATERRDGFGDIKQRLGRSPDEGDAVVYALIEGKSQVNFRRPKGPARTNSRYNAHNFRGKKVR
jgi:hypothetical protein